MKKKKDINSLSVEELKTQITEEMDSVKRMKLSHTISPLENPMLIRETKKKIARLNTALTAKAK